MASQPLLDLIGCGANRWNQARRREGLGLNLDLRRAHLDGEDLREFDFSGMDLTEARLQGADLREAVLTKARLVGANLRGADLRDADLRDADLSEASLDVTSLRGARIPGVKLPDHIKGFELLSILADVATKARAIFLILLLSCAYTALTVASVGDDQLLNEAAEATLPIIGAPLPIDRFFIFTPLVLLVAYIYFHLYLHGIWLRISQLPAMLPDGRSLHEAIDSWLILSLARQRSFPQTSNIVFWRAQKGTAILLAWLLVPGIIGLVWWQYLPIHKRVLIWQLLLATGAFAFCAYALVSALQVLRSRRSETQRFWSGRPFRWGLAVGAGTLLLGGSLTVLALRANTSFVEEPSCMRKWITADVESSEVSLKPATWTGGSEADLARVRPAQLKERNLRGLRGKSVFLVRADLQKADLQGSDLRNADARRGNFVGADLRRANLAGADLRGAILIAADLTDAVLGSYMTSAGHDFDATIRESSDGREAQIELDARGLTARRANSPNSIQLPFRRTDLRGADLSLAVAFEPLDLQQVCIDASTKPPEPSSFWQQLFQAQLARPQRGCPPIAGTAPSATAAPQAGTTPSADPNPPPDGDPTDPSRAPDPTATGMTPPSAQPPQP